ncbi:MAG: RNA polymerase sigma factor [Acidobacteria bacterium]|nr:RNA polymerase sigma factor [Acidobacteriota bacterium]
MSRYIEQNLIDRSRRGDAEAFGEIYFALKDSIYGFAYRMTNAGSIAEEITQEVFVFFIENAEKYDADKGSLFSFLCAVARNKVLNHLKKSGTKLETNNFEEVEIVDSSNGSGRSPLKNLLDKEFSAKVEECVFRLSPFQREVLLLREMEELSYEEISQITSLSIGVIKSRLYRARQTLVSELSPYAKSEKVNIYEVHRS